MKNLRNFFKSAPDLNRFDALIGKDLSVSGDLSFKKTLRIDGSVYGDIRAAEYEGSVLIVNGKTVARRLVAETIVINGTVTAKDDDEVAIVTDKLVLSKTAVVECVSVNYNSMSVEPGARFTANSLICSANAEKKSTEPAPEIESAVA